jgi:Uma2 family endonuclease
MDMGFPMRKMERKYTYGDYKNWPEGERWELIDGIAYNMSPAPSRRHQDTEGRIFYVIYDFLKNRPFCKVYLAPFDVLLPENEEQEEDDIFNVVQPDIVVFCDPSKLTEKGARGAPDWAIEILSPYTSKKDMNEKFSLYERKGVKEYWIVDPGNRYIHVYSLGEDGKFGDPFIYIGNSKVRSRILEELEIDLEAIFRE